MRKLISLIFFSLMLSLIPAREAFAITHSHPAPIAHSEPHEEENTSKESVKTVKTVTHTVTHTTSHPVSTTKNSKEKSAGSQDKEKQPLPVSTTAISKSVAKFFAKEGNPSTLDRKQVYHLAKDPHIKGQEAATLAALILAINNAKKPATVKFSEARLLADFQNPKSHLYYYYTIALANMNGIRTLPKKDRLFGPGGITYKTQIIQESDDDCYFLSAINSILQTQGGAKMLKNMITPVKGSDDEFSVKFPGKSTPDIVKLTDTEVGMYSQLSAGGKWLAILSVAEAMQRDQSHLDPEKTIEPGYQTQTFRLLTGEKYTLYDVPSTLSKKDIQWLIDTITSALNDNLLVGIETNVHDLSIIGYENGDVIIKNPWGTSGWYNPVTAGSSNSPTQPTSAGPWYLMENGVFSVPIANIPQGFTQVAYHEGEKSNVSASFKPRLPVPTYVNGLPENFTPSLQVAPMQYIASSSGEMDSSRQLNDEPKEKQPLHCNYSGTNPTGCTGN